MCRRCIVLLALISVFLSPKIARSDDESVGGAPTDLLPDKPLRDGGTLLPDGWKLSPAGKATQLAGDMPTQMILTTDGKYLLTSTGGYNEHGISVVEVASGN